jgi:aminocarboxymuconate-semialdehyde decarboxylase
MRYIDAFNHFFPQALWDKMMNSEGAAKDIGKRMRGIPCIYDINERLKCVDMFRKDHDYKQVISLGMPPLESLGTPAQVEEFARLGNDGMAELVHKHPDQFCGFLASLPMNSDNAWKEAERAFQLGANAIQLHTNINGDPLDHPKYFPVFELAAKHGKPIFLHPSRAAGDVRFFP